MKKKYFITGILIVVGIFMELIAGGGFRDGPYVFYEKDQVVSVRISGNEVIRDTLSAVEEGSYYLSIVEGIEACVPLKSGFAKPEATYELPLKFMVISDIHGNLSGLRELLLSGEVIDSDNNWVYDGWLIIDGDVQDRGEEVTGCFWLLYHLYLQAEESPAGKVLFLLGNHENMSIAERIHVVEGKYKNTCDLLGITYNELYGAETFLGRWIRSWHTVLTLGDQLIVHGGIAGEFTERFFELQTANMLVYDYYQGDSRMNEDLQFLFGRNGPFWYRGYFSAEDKWQPTSAGSLENIFRQYKVSKIIVGHTSFDDIKYAWEGKVIAIDAGLKYQKSGEALIYERGKYFVLASSGEKLELVP
jgi:hypothetical protein